MERRIFIKNTVAAAAAMATPFIGKAVFAKDKIAIGGPVSLSGVFANVGLQIGAGNLLAAEFFSRTLPVQLEYAALDDQSDPGKAVLGVIAAMQRGVKHFSGTSNSASGLAASKEIHKTGGIYVCQAGADAMTGTDCNRSTFRWPVGTYGAIEQSLRPLIAQNPKAKRWYTITGQYVFGESLLQNTKRVLADTGCEHIGNSYHSLAEKEFSGYIANAIAMKPDVLCVANFGNQTLDVIRAAVSFGLKRNTIIVAPWSTGLDQFQALGSDLLDGLYFGAQYWHDLKSPGNTQFIKAFSENNKGRPTYTFASGFACTQLLAEGIMKSGSSDYREIIKSLEGLEYDGVSGREIVRANDHQILKDYYLMKGKSKSAMKDEFDFVDIISRGKSFLAPEQTGCKMPV